MWITELNGIVQIFANSPTDSVAEIIKEQNPEAKIYRSKKPCINDVNEILFQIFADPGPEIEIEREGLGENGEPIKWVEKALGPSVTRSAENEAFLEDNFLILRSKQGSELARFALEAVL